MGCDIHPYMEVCIDGVWYLVSRLGDKQWRNYSLFGKLSGVRSDARNVNGEFPERGFTCEVSDDEDYAGDYSREVQFEYELISGDAHSFSVLYYDDMVEFVKFYDVPATKDVKQRFSEMFEHELKNNLNWGGLNKQQVNGVLEEHSASYVRDWLAKAQWLMSIECVGDVRVVMWYDN